MRYLIVLLTLSLILLQLFSITVNATITIPWHMQGWKYRAIVKPAGTGWNIIDLSEIPQFLQYAREDLSDVRVLSYTGSPLSFYVAEYSRYDGIVKLAVYVPDPPPYYILIYWGISSTAAVQPAYIYAPDQLAGEKGAILFDQYIPGKVAIYTANLSWASTWNDTGLYVWVVSANNRMPIPYFIVSRSTDSISIVVNASAPFLLVWGTHAIGNVTQLNILSLELTVYEQSGSTLNNYAVRVQLNNSNFLLWNFLQPNCNNIYFTDSNGNPLYYYIETCDIQNRKFIAWVKIPYLPANEQTTIYIHFSTTNPYASYNNPDKVFLFWDDFVTDPRNNGWILDTDILYQWDGDIVTINNMRGMAYHLPFVLNAHEYIIEAKVRVNQLPSYYSGTFASPMSSPYTAGCNGNADATVLYMTEAGSTYVETWIGSGSSSYYDIVAEGYVGWNIQIGTWYITGIVITPSKVELYVNGVKYVAYPVSWAKDLVYIRIGFFTPYYTYSGTYTSYDWVRIRPYVEPEPDCKISDIINLDILIYQIRPTLVEWNTLSDTSIQIWPVEMPDTHIYSVPAVNASFDELFSAIPDQLIPLVVYGLPLLPLLLVPAGYAGAGVVASSVIAWAMAGSGYAPWSASVLETLVAVAVLAVAVMQRKD